MLRMFIVFLFLFLHGSVYAASVGGLVTDKKTLSPIAGAELEIYKYDADDGWWDRITSVTSNEQGRYVFRGLEAGTYHLYVRAQAYKSQYYLGANDWSSKVEIVLEEGANEKLRRMRMTPLAYVIHDVQPVSATFPEHGGTVRLKVSVTNNTNSDKKMNFWLINQVANRYYAAAYPALQEPVARTLSPGENTILIKFDVPNSYTSDWVSGHVYGGTSYTKPFVAFKHNRFTVYREGSIPLGASASVQPPATTSPQRVSYEGKVLNP